MKAAVALLRVLAARDDVVVLVEGALLDGDIDSDDILPDNATCTDVKVTR